MSLKTKLIEHLKQVRISTPEGEITNDDSVVKYTCVYHGGRLQGTVKELFKKDSPCEQCSFLLNQAHVFNLNGKPAESPKIKEISMFWLGKFDYTKMMVTDTKTKGVIICPTHGEFSASLIEHVRGFNFRGCPECAKETANPAKAPLDWFERAKEIVSGQQ